MKSPPDQMTALYLLFGITSAFVLAVALSEWLFRRRFLRGQAAGCTCLDDMHYYQDCPLHGWPSASRIRPPKRIRPPEKRIVLTRREDGGADLMVDDHGHITEIDLPKRDKT